MRNFLLTLFSLDGYHGSVIHVCEIANYLKSQNYNVIITAVVIDYRIGKIVEEKTGANIYQVTDFPVDMKVDYVLAYHWPILPYLIYKGVTIKKIMCGTLSSIESMETPSFLCKYGIPLQVHNLKIKEYIVKNYNIDSDLIHLMRNIVPLKYFSISRNSDKKKLQSIAIVSNHVPSELRECVVLLQGKNINVDIYGKEDNYTFITPEILSKYDAVVSIGKTVQYSMALGIPVYNYDRFGGSGYITVDNIDKEEFHNFSGRSYFRKLNAEEICDEIITNYSTILAETDRLKNIAKERYSIDKCVNELIRIMDKEITPNMDYIIKEERMNFEYSKCMIERITDLHTNISVPKLSVFLKNKIKFVYYKYILRDYFKAKDCKYELQLK